MKKIICFLLCLVTLLSLAACGEYSEGTTVSRETQDTIIEIPPDSVDPDDPNTSVVTLKVNGMPIMETSGFYMLYLEMDIYAQWSDGHTMVIAKFDENGVAMASGLDGDYKVTLSAVPGDYIYNVNGIYTTNDNRRIELDLYRILYGDGPGTDYYYPYIKEFSDQGVYEITIDSPEHLVMCRFAPGVSGVYTIESWNSVAEDNVNPIYDKYYGSPAYVYFAYTINDGGEEGVYTKNFKEVRTISQEEIGNVFIFGIRATAKDGQYPVKVLVSVLKTREYDEMYPEVLMKPQEVLRRPPEHSSRFTEYWQDKQGSTLLDASKCRLWKAEDGGDGYYHIYDEELYAATNGWGPTLYAQITASTIMGYSLNTLEWQGNGNNMLSLKANDTYYRYKQFIEGFESLATEHGGNFVGTNYCVADCPCHANATGSPVIMACVEFCEKCSRDCTQVKPEMYGTPGYANAVNSDGVYPVTEELQIFLQLFAECHNLFCDGTGDAEVQGLSSDQASMWLWAVGYYPDDEGGLCQMGEIIPNYFD